MSYVARIYFKGCERDEDEGVYAGVCVCVCSEDMFAQESIDLLWTCGLQFKKHEEEGVDVVEFAELLMTSGIVLMDNIKWISFHR